MESLEHVKRSQPYKPRAGSIGALVGRDHEARLIQAAWMGGRDCLPLAPLLIGEPGMGKNRIIYELAESSGKNLYIFQGHEDVTAEDLACSVRIGQGGVQSIEYVLSALVTAMLEGGICFVDEIAKIRPRALALLVSVLDERRYIDSGLLGERVYAHTAFRFVAATNSADLDRNSLPDFIESRMRPTIEVGYPSSEEIERIIESRFPRLQADLKPALDQFWIEWRRFSPDTPPTPRDGIQVFTLASSLADFDAAGSEGPAAVTPDHVAAALTDLFRSLSFDR